jgi:hypothetical protein
MYDYTVEYQGDVQLNLARNLPNGLNFYDFMIYLTNQYSLRYTFAQNTLFIDSFPNFLIPPGVSNIDLTPWTSEKKIWKEDFQINRAQTFNFPQDSNDSNNTTNLAVENIFRAGNEGTSTS